MRFLRGIFRAIMRRFGMLVRLLVGGFMLLMGGWFLLAPFTQQFYAQLDILADMPALWLIVPLGILQIAVGVGILRPVFSSKDKKPSKK
ncbi:MAG: hypothetical protein AAFR81_14945 [Chloroflexota bacterium]